MCTNTVLLQRPLSGLLVTSKEQHRHKQANSVHGTAGWRPT